MKDLQFPINFKFNIISLSNDFTATDANGKTVAYVRQKLFKLKEDITIYADESMSKINYSIKADRWLDFSAAYTIYDQDGSVIGKIVRKGWKSIWKAQYEIIDQHDHAQFKIDEENPWIKVADSILGEIPLLGMLTGYLFHPSYIVTNYNDSEIVKLTKFPSLWSRHFELIKVGHLDSDDDDRIMLGLMMMILLERKRG